MRTPEDVRSWARSTYNNRAFTWLGMCADGPDVDLSLPLHPPAASTALDEGSAVAEWIGAWAHTTLPAGCELVWEERRWRALGTQRVPVAVKVNTATGAAQLAGRAKDWALLTGRLEAIRGALSADHEVAEATALIARTMKSCARDLREAEDADFSRALEVTRWLLDNPDSGLYLRQLPIAGVDTKWVERHRRLITALLKGARELAGLPGEGTFGCAPMPHPRTVVIADPALRPAGIRYLMADGAELAALWDASVPAQPGEVLGDVRLGVVRLGVVRLGVVRPQAVLVIENKQSLLAVPDLPGVVALHGDGYAVDWIGTLPWVLDLPVVYWGDLDEDGLLILHRLRQHHGDVTSVMMDAETFSAFRDLAVPDPHAPAAPPASLTAEERLAWEAVHDAGGLRLEQERINWAWAKERLVAALRHAPLG